MRLFRIFFRYFLSFVWLFYKSISELFLEIFPSKGHYSREFLRAWQMTNSYNILLYDWWDNCISRSTYFELFFFFFFFFFSSWCLSSQIQTISLRFEAELPKFFWLLLDTVLIFRCKNNLISFLNILTSVDFFFFFFFFFFFWFRARLLRHVTEILSF